MCHQSQQVCGNCNAPLESTSAAIVWFFPVFAQYFLNLKRDYGSGSAIFPNLGPDPLNGLEWSGSGSELVWTSKPHKYIYIFQIYSSNAQYHTNSINSLVEFLTRGSRSPTCCPLPLDITNSLTHSPRICLLLYML